MRKIAFIFTIIASLGIWSYSANATKSITVPVIQKYLNNITTLQADFKQSGYDGSEAFGKFFLSRPGKLRFEYNDPIKDFIVADGKNIYFYDSEIEQASHTSIDNTLANFILRKNLSFSNDVQIINKGQKKNTYYITVIKKGEPEAGKMSLLFNIEPKLTLKKWVVFDSQGYTTEIELSNLDTETKLDKKLFSYIDPNKEKKRFN